MRFSQAFGSTAALALIVLHTHLVQATPILGGGLPRRLDFPPSHDGVFRTMRPIRRLLEKRDQADDFTLETSSFHMEFIEETSIGSTEPFVATIKAIPHLPIVMLEDLGPLLRVHCFGHGIGLTFATTAHAIEASKAWGPGGFVVMTHHDGCNVDGERVPFTVSASNLHHTSSSIVLEAKPAAWEAVAHGFDVQFGPRNTYEGLDMDSYRPSKALLARPSLEARDMTGHLNFNWSHKSLQLNNGGMYIKQICVECWATGTLTLHSGHFKFKKQSDIVVPAGEKASLSHMAHFATVSLISKNVHTLMRMETDVMPGLQKSWPLLPEPIGLPGLDFEFLVIGPKWNPHLVGKVQTLSPFKFHYGFEINVPDGSLLSLDLINPGQSSAAGFHQAKFTALPFKMETPRLHGFRASLAYRNIIEFGITVGTASLNPITLFEDIPQYDISFEYLSDADDNCRHMNLTTTASPSSTSAVPALDSTYPTAAVHALASTEDLDAIYADSGAPPTKYHGTTANFTRTWSDFIQMDTVPPENPIIFSSSISPTTSSIASSTSLGAVIPTPISHSSSPPSTVDSDPPSFDLYARAVPSPGGTTPSSSSAIIPFHANHVLITTGWSMDIRIGNSWTTSWLDYRMGPSITLSSLVFSVKRHCMPFGPLVSDVPGAQAVSSGSNQSPPPVFTSWDGTGVQW